MTVWLSAAFVVAGILFFIAGTIGLLRLPDSLTRLHALTKADNVGLGLLVLGLLFEAPTAFYAVKLVLIWLLVLLAGATGTHLIAKRALSEERTEAE
ncbi:MAG: monovalent cation/H(+) antiporter subunit G [Chromatiaceae bacterium]